MKKAFKMQDLGCANCAAKMENDISKLEGVNKATISFMTQRFVLECDEGKLDEILDQAQQICYKYEPDCVILR